MARTRLPEGLLLDVTEALDLQGNTAQARAVRLDSLGWARYGFGSERAVPVRSSEIAALSSRVKKAGPV